MVGSISLNWRKVYWAVHRDTGESVSVIYFDFDDDSFKSYNSTRKYAGKHVESLDEEGGKVNRNLIKLYVLLALIDSKQNFCPV